MDFVEEVRKYVYSECCKDTSNYGIEPYEFHFKPTVKYADKLVDELGGDKEVVLIAAWLHDIGSIVVGRKDHHITGSEIAEKKLLELGYPVDKIEKVKKCILNHRGSRSDVRESAEEKIIAEADTLSNFESISGIFKAAFVYEGHTQGTAKVVVMNKLHNKWNQLQLESSRDLVRAKYEAAKVLFED